LVKNSKNNLYTSLEGFLDLKSEEYKGEEITDLIFSYFLFFNKSVKEKIIDIKDVDSINGKVKSTSGKNEKERFKFSGYNFPISLDFTKWGNIIKDDNYLMIAKKGSHLTYHVWKYENRNEIILKNDNIELLNFTDYFIKDNSSYDMLRKFKHQKFYFNKGQLVIKQLLIKKQLMRIKKKDKKFNNNFITCEIETREINNKLTPICFSSYNGKVCKSFYITDYSSVNDMLLTAIRSLLLTKYHSWNIYFHNLSLFDGVFIFKLLAEMPNSKIYPILKDGKMINLKLEWLSNNSKYYINFRDSYLMLPESLRKLSSSFGVEKKGYFPFSFLNDSLIPLNYEGTIPDFKYYLESNLSINDEKYDEKYKIIKLFYDNMKKLHISNSWNLKNETIKYCEQDCISLHQVISNFNSEVYNKFSLNIHNYPTLPSLAFSIWRTHYLKDHKIPIITGEIYNFIKQSYTGGHIDVYKPWGINIFRYDVNSLYPYVMANFPMPVNNIMYFEGDITKVNPEAFGFFECKVTTPEYLERPLLQTKVKINSKNSTVAPLGKWRQVIFSEEINEYKKNGYSFEILCGYTFDKENIFKEYVNELYSIKQKSPKNSTWYLKSKLLMNSLYGKFGMNPHLPVHLIIDHEEIANYQNDDNIIVGVEPLSQNKVIISLFNENIIYNFKINVSIASAITSYSRIYMSKFLGDNDLNIYYTDTDSIDVDKPLDNKLVGKELGQFKLEIKFL
jgi:hypothetical protein